MFFHGVMTFTMISLILFGAYFIYTRWILGMKPKSWVNEELAEKRAKLAEASKLLEETRLEVNTTLNLKAIEEEIEHLQAQIETLENA